METEMFAETLESIQLSSHENVRTRTSCIIIYFLLTSPNTTMQEYLEESAYF
jgi:hypothetical protein